MVFNLLYALFSLFVLAALVFGVLCALDAAQKPDDRWSEVDQPKMLFVVGCPLASLCCWPVGLGLSLWYWLGVRPRLVAL